MFVFATAQNVLGTLEVLSLYPLLILTLIAIVYEAFVSATMKEFRVPTGVLACLMIVLMSQKVEEDPSHEVEKSHYYTVAMSVLYLKPKPNQRCFERIHQRSEALHTERRNKAANFQEQEKLSYSLEQ